MSAHIAGWSHTPFGKLDDPDVEALIGRVAGPAIMDAGVEPADIDAVFVSNFNSGFSKQEFTSSLPMQTVAELRMKPATRLENACASGSAAIFAARDFIAAGRGRLALVVGAEKMTGVPTAETSDHLLGGVYRKEEDDVPAGPASLFGRIAEQYFQRFGDKADALAMIAAKNRRHGVDNLLAHSRKDLGFEFCRTISAKNPYVAPPLRRTDCSLVSDGAAAIVVSNEDVARGLRRSVRFEAAVQINDFLPMSRRDPTWFAGAEAAWSGALADAGLALDDLSCVETHDCFTIAELIQYEAMGLTERGDGDRAALEGWTDARGRLPVNRSGGLMSKGHPIGASGVSMHIMVAMQLTGEAGGFQLPKADIGAVFNMGGIGVANYCSILKRANK